MTAGLAGAGIAHLRSLFAAGQATPEAACAACLSQIAARDGAIGAFVHLDADRARQAARQSAVRWRDRAPLSALDGVPVAVKANIAVAGLPWHAGIGAYRTRVAQQDAACVAVLRQAGAVILGLVNMHEGALGGTTDNPWFGRTQNPRAPGFTAGGSSGGSAAAVAARFCTAALGTDTLGSVRIPSAYCGVFGHKPARGRVPGGGVVPLSPRLDEVGIHAPSAEDSASVLGVLTGGRDAPVPPAGRIALLDMTGQVELAPETASALEAAAERVRSSGGTIERLRLRDIDYGLLRRRALLLLEIEAESVHRAALRSDPDGFSPAFRAMLAWGVAQPAARVAAARREVDALAVIVTDAFAPYPAILAATTPGQAFAWGAEPPANQADITALASVTGLSATAFPTGTANGLPLSAQIIARDDGVALFWAGKATASGPS